MMKTVILGLDGCTWNILDKAIEKGYCPNLKQLKEQGIHGKLRSTIPPVTCPAWISFYTGKQPGNIGIHSFMEIDFDNKKMRPVKVNPARFDCLWNYLNEQGITTSVINVPGTYPPEEINGVMISGLMTPSRDNYTTGIDEKELSEMDYEIEPISPASFHGEKLENNTEQVLKKRGELIRQQIKEHDVTITVLRPTDTIVHYYNTEGKRDVVYKFYGLVDQEVGNIMDLLDFKEDNLFIISDHGQKEFQKIFYTNSWLREEGYLKQEKTEENYSFLKNIGLNRERLYRLFVNLGLKDLIKKLPTSLRRIFPSGANKKVPLDDMIRKGMVNLDNSIAVAEGGGRYGGIYVRDKSYKQEIKQKVSNLEFVTDLWECEELYGKDLDNFPDLIFMVNEKYTTNHGIMDEAIKDQEAAMRPSDHILHGVFLGKGKDIGNKKIEDAQLIDITPTVLNLYGINSDFDGKVIDLE